MNDTTSTQTSTLADDEVMQAAARRTLQNIESYAMTLAVELDRAAAAANEALAAMRRGQRVSGSWGHGPLGHQTPFDIARATTRLEAEFEQAAMYRHLGIITDDDIAAAYRAGAASGR